MINEIKYKRLYNKLLNKENGTFSIDTNYMINNIMYETIEYILELTFSNYIQDNENMSFTDYINKWNSDSLFVTQSKYNNDELTIRSKLLIDNELKQFSLNYNIENLKRNYYRLSNKKTF